MSTVAARFALRAYGLDVESDWALTGATPMTAPPPAAPTRVAVLPAHQFRARWGHTGERIFQPEFPDGRTRFTVDRGDAYYQLWLEDFGRYLVTMNGMWIGCEEGSAARAIQERVVFGHALPLAAVLRGREVIHAGTICGPAGAAAFLGVSGSGKTTLTANLVLRGARFMSDDVLALEVCDGDILAHPGPPFMAIRREEAWLAGADRLGPTIGGSDKLHVAPEVPQAPVPLRALYYLARGQDVTITPVEDDVRRVVLGQAFVPYLATPDRLVRHLELGQLIDRRVEQFRLQTPTDGLDGATLDAIEAHLRQRGGR